MRALLQCIAYKVPLGLSVLSVLILSQTLDLQTIAAQQGPRLSACATSSTYLLGIKSIVIAQGKGILHWNICRIPLLLLAYVLFFVASLMACHRAPFDLPEAESELIGGYHTEYGGLRWAWLMLAEYSKLLLMSMLGVHLFLGAWHTPFPNLPGLPLGSWTTGLPDTWGAQAWACFWILAKVLFVVSIKMVLRWTLPRLRLDQLMHLCWQYLTPAALLLVGVTLWWHWCILDR